MGKLDDARKQAEAMMQEALQQGSAFTAPNIAAAQADVAAIRGEAQAVDRDDPVFEPIDGVTYDEYVALCVKMQPAGADSAKQLEIAQANGFTEEKWKAVSDGYTQRCVQNQVFARRLGIDVMNADAS